MTPAISVIIPTYNRADLVTATVESVLKQTLENIEVMVVDDGSTDDTRSALKRFEQDARFHYFYQPNQGRSTARNLGIAKSRGEFLLFLDSDDLLLEGGLAALYNHAQRDEAAGVIAGLVAFIDSDGSSIPFLDEFGHSVYQKEYNATTQRRLLQFLLTQAARSWQAAPLQRAPLPRRAYPALLDGEQLLPGTFLVRRRSQELAGLFDPDLEPCEDSDFVLRLALGSEIACVSTPVVQMRRHSGNTPNAKFGLSAIKLYQKHLDLIKTNGLFAPPVAQRLKSRCLIHFADQYYRLARWGPANLYYSRAVFCCPSLALDARFWLKLAKAVLPPSFRIWLQSRLRHTPSIPVPVKA